MAQIDFFRQTIEELRGIQDAIWGGGTVLSDYRAITRAIRAGQGAKIPNGTEFIVPHSVYGDVHFMTMRQNVDKVAGDTNRPTVTIKVKYALSANGGPTAATFQYDRREAFAEAEIAYPANTKFRFELSAAYGQWAAGKYIFTPAIAIEPGYKFCINGDANEAMTSRSVEVYASAKATTALGTYTISADDEGTAVDLGIFGTTLNHAQRVSYGSNNGAESNIRQFLNGDGLMNDVFVPQTKYDMMCNSYTSLRGFLGGFPADFRECLQKATVHNISNTVFEYTNPAEAFTTSTAYAIGDTCTKDGWLWRCVAAHAAGTWTESHFAKISKAYGIQVNSEYTTEDYFWLPSRKEIYGTNENTHEDSETQLPYYAEVATADHDKLIYAKGAAAAVTDWERTPYAGYASFVRVCHAGYGGALLDVRAVYSYAVAPLAILA